MHKVTGWERSPLAIWGGGADALILAFADGLAAFSGGQVQCAVRVPIIAAALGPDGAIFATQTDRVLRIASGGKPQDVTAAFGGAPTGQRRVVRGACGTIHVEGCPKYRRLNGTFGKVPALPDGTVPLQLTSDIFGNGWSLLPQASAVRLLVLPADAPDSWQPVALPAGTWQQTLADCDGFVWIRGDTGVRCFWPRDPDAGWHTPTGVVTTGEVTALALSPDDRAMIALTSGAVVQLDMAADGSTVQQHLATLPTSARLLHADTDGTLWAACDDGLYQLPQASPSWHADWEQLPGHLSCGGNHDIFSVPWQGRLYTAGGLSRFWGYPTRQRIFDELFAFDPATGCWDVISQLSFPRRYNGIAELEGRIWIVGGEGELGERGGEATTLDVVEIYDPQTDTWEPGPTLQQRRTDPFVMTCGGRIWAVGGASDPVTKVQSVESIGPAETTWRFETPLPEPTRQGGCCALEGWLYVISIDGFFACDTETGRWDTTVPQPGPITQAPLVTAYDGEVWMMGGLKCASTRCYDPRTRTWRDGPSLPTEQSWGATAVLEGQLYITGGAHRSDLHDATIYENRTWRLRR